MRNSLYVESKRRIQLFVLLGACAGLVNACAGGMPLVAYYPPSSQGMAAPDLAKAGIYDNVLWPAKDLVGDLWYYELTMLAFIGQVNSDGIVGVSERVNARTLYLLPGKYKFDIRWVLNLRKKSQGGRYEAQGTKFVFLEAKPGMTYLLNCEATYHGSSASTKFWFDEKP